MPVQTRRQYQNNPADWNRLSQPLIQSILAKLVPSASPWVLAQVRLVSRAWRDAFTDYPWQEETFISRSTELDRFCQVRPCMRSLSAYCGRLGSFNLQPVHYLLHLTSLNLTGKAYQDDNGNFLEPLVGLGYLPASLRELSMEAVCADWDTFEHIHCPELTKLNFVSEQSNDDYTAELVRSLPSLKGDLFATSLHQSLRLKLYFRTCNGGQPKRSSVTETIPYYACLESLLHLTRLSITQGCFDSVAWAEDRDCESPLQEILLRKVDLHCGWVATAFQPLKRLQVLEIVSCPVQKKKSSRLQPIGSLRSLVLHRSSPFFLQLAPETLQSLSYQHRSAKRPDHPPIAGLTRLVRLELIAVSGNSAGNMPLQSPALEQLLLIECLGLDAAYLSGGGLENVRELHIEQNLEEYGPAVSGTAQNVAEYVRLGRLVEGLPKLEQLSGFSQLFVRGMAQALSSWHRSQCSGLEITQNSRSPARQQCCRWRKQRV